MSKKSKNTQVKAEPKESKSAPLETHEATGLQLPAPKVIVGKEGESAMIPKEVIAPNLAKEGYDLNRGYIDSTGNAALKDVIFYVRTVSNGRHGKNVHAKSLTHFWEGTEKQFKDAFERA